MNIGEWRLCRLVEVVAEKGQHLAAPTSQIAFQSRPMMR
jgi:hypothetical protein